MSDVPMQVEAQERYYQKDIGLSESAAFWAAWKDYESLEASKEISKGPLASIPGPVSQGLASSIQFVSSTGGSMTMQPDQKQHTLREGAKVQVGFSPVEVIRSLKKYLINFALKL
jgi:hypothetical protein